MHRRVGQRSHKRISILICLAERWQVGERMNLLFLFLLALLLLAILVRVECTKEGDLLPFLACRGGLGLRLQQMQGLTILLY